MAGLPSAFAQRRAPEPGDHPDDLIARRREEVLEVRARQAKVPTPAQIEASRALREAALDSGPQRILRGELRGLLALPRGLERLVVSPQSDRELAWGSARRGTGQVGRAGAAHGPVEANADRRSPRHHVQAAH